MIGSQFMKLVSLYYFSWFVITVFFIPVSQAQSPVNNKLLQADTVLQKHGLNVSAIDHNESAVLIQSLLEQFVRDGSKQLFYGTFVYLFEDKVQTVRVHREQVSNGQVLEKFMPMDGEQQKSSRLLKNDYCSLNNEWQYQFRANSSSFPFRVNNHYQQLSQHYDFSLSGVEMVAGISATGLSIKSKDPYRYGYQLWFEPKSATLLKYKLIDQKGQSIEQYLFTDITIQEQSEIPNELSQSSPCHELYQGMDKAFQEYFSINKIPAGYQLVSFRKGTIYQTERQAYQFQLSDGLSSVSIFIEDEKNSEQAINGVLKLGPVNIAGKNIGDHQVTIIGAIPILSALSFIKAVKKPNHKISKIDD